MCISLRCKEHLKKIIHVLSMDLRAHLYATLVECDGQNEVIDSQAELRW